MHKRPAVDLKVQNVSHSFGKQQVLNNVSFAVNPGEIFVIMGPSGTGKSVLLQDIIGLSRPDNGSILMNGEPVSLKRIQSVVSLVFQSGALFNSLSVFDNLALYLREKSSLTEKEIKERVDYALKILSLTDAIEKFPSALSGGMKKRVAIARSLVTEPQLILYDEPTSELDPVMSATIIEIIGTLKQRMNVTTVIVSHDRDLAYSIADRVAVMDQGKIIGIFSPTELKESKHPAIQSFFNPKIDPINPRFKTILS